MTNAILNHLLQSTAFAAVCAALTLMLRPNRAHVRYALWVAASLKFLIPFAALIALGRLIGHWILPPLSADHRALVVGFVMQSATRTVLPPATSMSAVLDVAMNRVPVIPLALGLLWGAGSVVIGARWGAQWLRVLRLLARGTVATDGRDLLILRRLEAESRRQRPLSLVMSDSAMEPSVFGFLKPRLLWPMGISAHLEDSQVEAILAHELAHVSRRDNLIAAFHLAVETTFWFHPLVWLIGARLVEERERACDEDVLRRGSEPAVYAQSILTTCRFAIESPVCAAGVTGADLKRRIETIMSERRVHELGSWKRMLLVAAAGGAIVTPIVLGLINAPRVRAQIGPLRIGEQRFEVASVKPNQSAERNGMLRRQPGGRITATNMPLLQLIIGAYQVSPRTLVGAPSWINDERFDIVAKMEGDPEPVPLGSGPDPTMLALRTLLAERFHLEVHPETRQLDVYALVLARPNGSPGPALRPSSQDCSPEAMRAMLSRGPANSPPPEAPGGIPMCGVRINPGRLVMGGMPLSMITRPFGEFAGRVVVDRTGLAGTWDVQLNFAPDSGRGLPPGVKPDAPPPVDPDAPSIFTAVQEQLGLKLESTKAPIEVLSIDRVERPSPD